MNDSNAQPFVVSNRNTLVAHNKDAPLATFALFAFNHEQFIGEAIEGALSQTYSPLEIILSDDASTDRTFEIMQEMASAYSGPHKITLNHNEHNLGIGEHVNKLFDMASGELLVIAAGDDISVPTRCELLVKAWLRAQRPAMLRSYWQVIDIDGMILDETGEPNAAYHDPKEGHSSAGILLHYLKSGDGQLPIHGATAAYSTKLVSDFRPLNRDVIAEDFALLLRALLLDRVTSVSEYLVKYRQHDNNVSRVDTVGPETFRIALTRNLPSYNNLQQDLLQVIPDADVGGGMQKAISVALSRFLKSATLIRDWPNTQSPMTIVSSIAYILAFGPNRHKKWLLTRMYGRSFVRKMQALRSFPKRKGV